MTLNVKKTLQFTIKPKPLTLRCAALSHINPWVTEYVVTPAVIVIVIALFYANAFN